MKRELGIARCGLACCLCTENARCRGCNSGECPDKDWCEDRRCSLEKTFSHCYDCESACTKACCPKSNHMDLHCSSKDTERRHLKMCAFINYLKYYGNEKIYLKQLDICCTIYVRKCVLQNYTWANYDWNRKKENG